MIPVSDLGSKSQKRTEKEVDQLFYESLTAVTPTFEEKQN